MEEKYHNFNFESVNNIFYKVFGISGLELFLKNGPEMKYRKVKTIFLRFFLFTVFPFYMLMHLVSFFSKGINLQIVAINVTIFLNASGGFVKCIYFIIIREKMESLCVKFEEFKSAKTDYKMAYDTMSSMSLWISKIIKISLYLTFVVFLCWTSFPLVWSKTVKSWLKIESTSVDYNITRRLGLPNKLIPCYYPFDTDPSPVFEIVYIVELITAISGLTYMMPFDFFFITVCQMFCSHIKVFNNAIINNINNTNFTINDVIDEHVTILKKMKLINEILSPILGMLWINSVISLCGLILSFSAGLREDLGYFEEFILKIRLYTFFLLLLGELLFYCILCSNIKHANLSIGATVWHSKWYNKDKDYVFACRMIILRCQKEVSIKAMGILKIDLSTFIDVLRLSYTYFTFLREIDK